MYNNVNSGILLFWAHREGTFINIISTKLWYKMFIYIILNQVCIITICCFQQNYYAGRQILLIMPSTSISNRSCKTERTLIIVIITDKYTDLFWLNACHDKVHNYCKYGKWGDLSGQYCTSLISGLDWVT